MAPLFFFPLFTRSECFAERSSIRKHLYWFLPLPLHCLEQMCSAFLCLLPWSPPRNCLCRPTLSVVVTRSRRTSALTYSCCVWPRGSRICGSHLFFLVSCISTQEEETYPPADFFSATRRSSRAKSRNARRCGLLCTGRPLAIWCLWSSPWVDRSHA